MSTGAIRVLAVAGFLLLAGSAAVAQTSHATAGVMQQGRFFHAASLLRDGRVLMSHGLRNALFYNETCEVFDPEDETFTPTTCSDSHRRQHRSALLSDGRVLVFGNDVADEPLGEFVDVGGGESIPLAQGVTPARVGATVTTLLDGRLLIVGGRAGLGGAILTAATIYYPVDASFSSAGESAPFFGHAATRLIDGRVLIAGGLATLRTAQIFDPVAMTFFTVGDLVQGREDHRMALLHDGTVLVSGGSDGPSRNTAELFDPDSGSFTLLGTTMSSPREDHVSVALFDGRVLVGGGEDNTASGDILLASADLYDPLSLTFSPIADFVETRDDATGTLLANGTVLIAGGAGPLSLGQRSAELWATCAVPSSAPESVGATLRLTKEGNRAVLRWTQTAGSASYVVRRGISPEARDPEPWRVALQSESWTSLMDGADAFFDVLAVNVCGVPE